MKMGLDLDPDPWKEDNVSLGSGSCYTADADAQRTELSSHGTKGRLRVLVSELARLSVITTEYGIEAVPAYMGKPTTLPGF